MNKSAEYLIDNFDIDKNIIDFVNETEYLLAEQFKRIEDIAEFNQYKVTSAFMKNTVSDRHFNPTSGYGYSDEGRDKLSEVFACIFDTDSAIVSPMLMSGTHAITVSLFGLLRPGDTLLCISGRPYDTFNDVINSKSGYGSLIEWGINSKTIDLINNCFDEQRILNEIIHDKTIRVIHIQKSRGYEPRKTLSCDEIGAITAKIKEINKDIVVFIDNCYGEFTETIEPTQVGADVCAGSLIKNPGGGIAPSGGYIVGKKQYIDMISNRYSAPGIGTEIGSYAHSYKEYFQGLFLAPHIVKQALKGAVLISACMERFGIDVVPPSRDNRYDITQTIIFNDEKLLTEFIRGIQKSSPVDSNVVPYAWDMPGYEDKVIMAAGTFVQGATSELSVDGPIREPYAAYIQGGLTYENVKLSLMMSIKNMNLL